MPAKTTPLHQSAKIGDIPAMLQYIQDGALIDELDALGKTALIVAASHGNYDAVNALISLGASIDITDRYQQTALLCAIKNGIKPYNESERFFSTIQSLLDAGANPNTKDASKKTSLMYATNVDWKEVVQLLIAKGADVNERLPNGDSALVNAILFREYNITYVCHAGETSTWEFLLDNGGHIELVEAIELNDESLIEEHLAKHIAGEVAFEDYALALEKAAARGQTNTIRKLLFIAPKVDCKKALLAGGRAGHSDVVSLLMAGADINLGSFISGHTPLIGASTWGHSDVVALLIERGADINYQTPSGRTALSSASYHGHSDIVTLLLNAGADMEIREENYTAIQIAATNRHDDLVRLLYQRGAKLGLLEAVIVEDLPAIQRLLADKPNPNDEPSWRRLPLNVAVKKNWLPAVELLVQGGFDINFYYDNSALMCAARNGYVEIAKYLLSHGADANATSPPEDPYATVLSEARESGNENMLALVKSAGAYKDKERNSTVSVDRGGEIRLWLDRDKLEHMITNLEIKPPKTFEEKVEMPLAGRRMCLIVPNEEIEIPSPSLETIEDAVRKSFHDNGLPTVLVVDVDNNLFIQNDSDHVEYNEYNGGTIYATDNIDVDTAVHLYLAYARGEESWKTAVPWTVYLTEY